MKKKDKRKNEIESLETSILKLKYDLQKEK